MDVGDSRFSQSVVPSTCTRLAWRIETSHGEYPLWVGTLASALTRETGRDGVVIGCHPQQPALPLLTRAGWWLDSALFGQAQALAVGSTSEVAAALRPGGLIVRLVGEADPACTSSQLTLEVGDMPASRMVEAVEHAMASGQGSLAVRAQWHEPGSAQKGVSWQCYLDERSRSRTLDSIAEKLVHLAALMVRKSGSLHNNMPLGALLGNPRLTASPPTYRALRHAARRFLAHDQWAITVHRGVASDVLWPDSSGIDLIPPPHHFWADPFVVREYGRLWVFFEDLPYATQRGRIACVTIDADGQVSDLLPVLEEPCHLSYPNVFQHEGQWFMLPESSARRNLVLYRARQLPGPWEPVAELFTQVRMADATLHHNRERWWLTASVATDAGCIYDELHIYSAARLEGPWQASPHNPVRVDPAWSRPAGPWFRWNGRPARPVQDCRGRYGRAVQILSVESIGEAGFREIPVAALTARAGGLASGVHTYSRVGSDLAIDWVRWRTKLMSRNRSSQGQVELAPAGDCVSER